MTRKQILQYSVVNDETLKKFHAKLSARNFQSIMDSEKYDLAVNELDRVIFEDNSNACPIITITVTSKDREKPWIAYYLNF